MIKIIIGIFSLLFISTTHADTNKDVLQNGTYYIQDGVAPQKDENGEYVISYRPESINEFYFKVQNNKVTIYYYKSGDNWVSGRAEATYNPKKHDIVVKKIVESIHMPNDTSKIKVGDNLNGKELIQVKSEIIPVYGVTGNGFIVGCDKYVSENGIQAFDFPDNYIMSTEGAYCNQAYDDDGELTHLKIKAIKIE